MESIGSALENSKEKYKRERVDDLRRETLESSMAFGKVFGVGNWLFRSLSIVLRIKTKIVYGYSTMHIRQDGWILRPHAFRPISLVSVLSENAWVFELVLQDGADWNLELLNQIFCAEDAEAISALPIPNTLTQDKLIWHFSATGEFSVRSAYNLAVAVERRELQIGVSNDGEVSRMHWNFIRKIKVPNKVEVFPWRLCKQILPNTMNLRRRRLQIGGGYLKCVTGDEDDEHVMLGCPFARQTWAL
ncbi:hypothetical protein Salat_2419400 [Sesamum alatum]|uniref:Reverse transcriptase zinc-binding domain-containing protein n=1 Tax=Sesamum alatum TaxID=300844 RepID=A0AAE2CFE4_9LAMI|nr:hypothetical protein Salat_2419400 [Sesamum alatum]